MNAVERIIDCHVHVFDPARFPYAADSFYKPSGAEIATADHLRFLMESHGVQHALIVGPNSGYNLDNRCMLDALAKGKGQFKGIAVVRNDASHTELADLQAAGVVGAAFQVELMGVDFYRDIGPLLERLRDLDMWAQVQVHADQLVLLKPMLEDCGARLLFDHCGRPDPLHGLGQAGFQALLELANNGRTYAKLSALNKCSGMPYPHPDAWPYVKALIDAYTPQRLMWGSDWPFLRASERIDYGPLLALITRLIPDSEARRAILWDTPSRLFQFANNR